MQRHPSLSRSLWKRDRALYDEEISNLLLEYSPPPGGGPSSSSRLWGGGGGSSSSNMNPAVETLVRFVGHSIGRRGLGATRDLRAALEQFYDALGFGEDSKLTTIKVKVVVPAMIRAFGDTPVGRLKILTGFFDRSVKVCCCCCSVVSFFNVCPRRTRGTPSDKHCSCIRT